MTYTISKTNLIAYCCLLFDSEIINYVEFLNSLSPSKLRSAYRKKAFETHPDRSRTLGKNKDKMDKCFKDMITAYERLDSIIQGGKKYIIRDEVPKKKKARSASRRTQTKSTKQKSAPVSSYKNSVSKTRRTQKIQKRVSDRYYNGNIPECKLLIGQFLYYSGLISWKTLFDAVYWQRKQRPIIGKIAKDWGILSSVEIQRILKERSYKDNFG
ncbi:MAG: J domain-containing protein, partial [Planctomycetota bacterium]